MAADVLTGTVTPYALAYAITAHVPMRFVSQNVVDVGGGLWSAPTLGAIPPAAAFAFAATPTGPADWAGLINGVVALGPVEFGSHAPVVDVLAAAGFTTIAQDIAYGANVLATGASNAGFAFPHWGSV